MKCKEEELKQMRREYIEAIQPYINIKANIYAIAIPTIVVEKVGSLPQAEYNFTDEQLLTLDQLDQLIQNTGERILSKHD